MAGLLSSAQLTQVRAQATASLDRTCTLTTRTLGTSDGAGGFGADTEVTASVACRVAPPSGRERVIAERLGQEVDAIITLPHGTACAPTTAITDSNGTVYESVYSNADDSYRTATRVYARALKGAGV